MLFSAISSSRAYATFVTAIGLLLGDLSLGLARIRRALDLLLQLPLMPLCPDLFALDPLLADFVRCAEHAAAVRHRVRHAPVDPGRGRRRRLFAEVGELIHQFLLRAQKPRAHALRPPRALVRGRRPTSACKATAPLGAWPQAIASSPWVACCRQFGT